jgi:hypothetical protein
VSTGAGEAELRREFVAWPPVYDVPEVTIDQLEHRYASYAATLSRFVEENTDPRHREVQRRKAERIREGLCNGVRGHCAPLVCVETGEAFPSIVKAAERYLLSPVGLRNAFPNGADTSRPITCAVGRKRVKLRFRRKCGRAELPTG